MLGFIKKRFFTGLAFLSILTGVNSLSYISLNNRECKVIVKNRISFYHLVLKQVNVKN